MNKKFIKIIVKNPLTCETCGKPIYQNERVFFLFMNFYHFKCGYNN